VEQSSKDAAIVAAPQRGSRSRSRASCVSTSATTSQDRREASTASSTTSYAAKTGVGFTGVKADGTHLSQLHAVDGNGYGLTAAVQGAGGDLYPNQWNRVTSDIGAVAAGKTITRVTFANGIKAEMTPTDHAAVFRFTFTGASSNLIFDNVNDNGGLVLDPATNSISGYSDVQGGRRGRPAAGHAHAARAHPGGSQPLLRQRRRLG
jgi:glycosyl hydrolase family 92